MALATQCPHCQTRFRVANDQLKLRAGLVRCGACKQIFNGIEHLVRTGENAPPLPSRIPASPEKASSSPISPPAPATETEPSSANSASPDSAVSAGPITSPQDRMHSGGEPDRGDDQSSPSEHQPMALSMQADDPAHARDITTQEQAWPSETDPMQRMTLMDFSRDDDDSSPSNAPDAIAIESQGELGSEERTSPDELDKAIEALQRKPMRKSGTRPLSLLFKRRRSSPSPEETEDALFDADVDPAPATQQRAARYLKPGLLFLAVILVAQLAYLMRHAIATTLPEVGQIVRVVCGALHCDDGLPQQIDMVSIESSELQSLPNSPNVLSLSVSLRNKSSYAQAWPHMELTLNDANEQPLLRRIFVPKDYLPSTVARDQGFPGNTGQAVKLTFELLQLKASGYKLYLFYP